MVQFEDYYKILGISRDAKEAEIKKAYRKLAREYHPDRNQKNKEEAEAKFKKINEAYDVLSNFEKRAQYDRLGRIPHGSEFRPPPGFDFDMNSQHNFADIFNLFFNTGGAGASESNNIFGFGGGGGMAVKGENLQSTLQLTLAEAYQGITKKIRLAGQEAIEVKIPPQVQEGSKIRVSAKGNPSSYGGPPGDLILNVKLLPSNEFSLQGSNVESKLFVSVIEAIFGTTKKVKTLNGNLDLTVPAGIQSGQKLRLSGQGWQKKIGGKGDHLVQILIRIPENLSEREKELYAELKALEEVKND